MAHELGKVPVHQVGNHAGATDMTNNSWERSLGKQALADKTWQTRLGKQDLANAKNKNAALPEGKRRFVRS
jgi:hypothetical protein